MLKRVTIKSTSTDAKLELLDVGHEYFTVIFSSAALSACKRVWDNTKFQALVELFQEMASKWRGWESDLTWSSIEGEFILSCTCDKLGHITLSVELVQFDGPEP